MNLEFNKNEDALKLSVSNLNRKLEKIYQGGGLKKLEKVGFLISEKRGNTKIYSTNKSFPIFKELQGIVLKSQRANQKSAAGNLRR